MKCSLSLSTLSLTAHATAELQAIATADATAELQAIATSELAIQMHTGKCSLFLSQLSLSLSLIMQCVECGSQGREFILSTMASRISAVLSCFGRAELRAYCTPR